jgi:hypothetical protein
MSLREGMTATPYSLYGRIGRVKRCLLRLFAKSIKVVILVLMQLHLQGVLVGVGHALMLHL